MLPDLDLYLDIDLCFVFVDQRNWQDVVKLDDEGIVEFGQMAQYFDLA